MAWRSAERARKAGQAWRLADCAAACAAVPSAGPLGRGAQMRARSRSPLAGRLIRPRQVPPRLVRCALACPTSRAFGRASARHAIRSHRWEQRRDRHWLAGCALGCASSRGLVSDSFLCDVPHARAVSRDGLCGPCAMGTRALCDLTNQSCVHSRLLAAQERNESPCGTRLGSARSESSAPRQAPGGRSEADQTNPGMPSSRQALLGHNPGRLVRPGREGA